MLVVGGMAGCVEIWNAVSAREARDYRLSAIRRMRVDTYCLQHPGLHSASPKLLVAHVVGLCWQLEFEGDRAAGGDALRRWLNAAPPVDLPSIPASRGALTIASVRDALSNPQSYAEVVECWARSTWQAYDSFHGLARLWVARAQAANAFPRRW